MIKKKPKTVNEFINEQIETFIRDGVVTPNHAKVIAEGMSSFRDKTIDQVVDELGIRLFHSVPSSTHLDELLMTVIVKNINLYDTYLRKHLSEEGINALNRLVGLVMRESKGQANPSVISALFMNLRMKNEQSSTMFNLNLRRMTGICAIRENRQAFELYVRSTSSQEQSTSFETLIETALRICDQCVSRVDMARTFVGLKQEAEASPDLFNYINLRR